MQIFAEMADIIETLLLFSHIPLFHTNYIN